MFKGWNLFLVLALIGTEISCDGLFATDYYGAIAYSEWSSKISSSNNKKTLGEAKIDALRTCSYKDCFIATFTKNGCVAAARSYGDQNKLNPAVWYGFGQDPDQKRAENLALEICEYDAKDYCVVIESFCTRNDQAEEPAASLEEVLALVPEKSQEAYGILKVVNIFSGNSLRDKVGVSPAVAERFGTHGYFGTIEQVVKDTQLSKNDLLKLLGYARTNGYIKEKRDPKLNPVSEFFSDSRGRASEGGDSTDGFSTLELYLMIVKMALPTENEAQNRKNCILDSWANIGQMGCECKLQIPVSCNEGGKMNATTLRGFGQAVKPVFTSVCTAAAEQAKRRLEIAAYQFDSSCASRGGVPLKTGPLEFYK